MSEFNNTMKTFDLKSLLIGVLLTMVIVAFMLAATASGSRAWEYKKVTSPANMIDSEVTKLGDEGWDIVGYTFAKDQTGQRSDYHSYILKRAKRTNLDWKFWK